METYGLPKEHQCNICHIKSAMWRCETCHGRPLLCRGCCRGSHQKLLLHRVSKWNGKCFEKAALWQVGVYLLVDHMGEQCPTLKNQIEMMEQDEKRRDEELSIDVGQNTVHGTMEGGGTHGDDRKGKRRYQETENEQEENTAAASNDGGGSQDETASDDGGGSHDETAAEQGPAAAAAAATEFGYTAADDDDPYMIYDEAEDPAEDAAWEEDEPENGNAHKRPIFDRFGNIFVTIVDVTGLHDLPLVICHGHSNTSTSLRGVEEALFLGYFAASFKDPKTFFTFGVLDDFRRSNLDCGTSIYQYWQKIRRTTNPAFPALVHNRYAELRRMSRQWRYLKKLKWHGFGNEKRKPGKGELSLFCAACPQDGRNLPPDWREDQDK